MGFTNNLGIGVILSATDMMSGPIRNANNSLKQLEISVGSAANTLEAHMKTLNLQVERNKAMAKTGMGVAAAGVAVMAPLAMATKVAISFQQELKDIKALLVPFYSQDESEALTEALGKRIRAVANSTPVPLIEISKATWDFISANLTAKETMEVLKPTVDMVVASMGTMEGGTDVMTQTLNTFGKSWGNTMTTLEKSMRIAKAISTVSAVWNTDLPRLEEAFRYSGGLANTAGVDYEEFVTLTGIAQTVGLQNTLAGTSYNAYLRYITQLKARYGGTEKGSGKKGNTWKKYFDELGDSPEMDENTKGMYGRRKLAMEIVNKLDIEDPLTKKLRPFPQILRQVESLFGVTKERAAQARMELIKSGQAYEKDGKLILTQGTRTGEVLELYGVSAHNLAVLQATFGDEGARLIASTLGQADAIEAAIKQTKLKSDLDAMVAARMEGVKLQWDEMKNKIQNLAITMGNVLLPTINTLITPISNLITSLDAFLTVHPSAAKWVVYGTLFAGAFLIAAGGLMTLWYSISGFIAARALIKLAAAMTTSTVATRGLTIAMMWNTIVTKVSSAGIYIAIVALYAWEYATKAVAIALRAIDFILTKSWWGLLIMAVVTAVVLLIENWDKVVAALKRAWKWFKQLLDDTPDWILAIVFPIGLIIKHWDKVREAGEQAWKWIQKAAAVCLVAITSSSEFQAVKKVFDAISFIFTQGEATGGGGRALAPLPSPSFGGAISDATGANVPGSGRISMDQRQNYISNLFNIPKGMSATELIRAVQEQNRRDSETSTKAGL
jgi:TP901 family phage tail tape measure protein